MKQLLKLYAKARQFGGWVLRRLGLRRDPRSFLKQARGIIHIGANDGQERDTYAQHGLPVLWIEALPEVYAKLVKNIEPFPNQKAICAVASDRTGVEVNFFVADNSGHSSSLRPAQSHFDMFPDVHFDRNITLKTTRLDDLVEREKIDLGKYDSLVMDVQGAELLVLKGGLGTLKHFKYVMLEVADFEAYQGGCLFKDVSRFMFEHGYRLAGRHAFYYIEGVGTYYDVLYAK